ncbi:MAG TPA: phospholipase D-like domain-containing protein [Stellaceae bacterium]|nr:phospholipase D-like domain-containing protein [Stellaceae bacterium]
MSPRPFPAFFPILWFLLAAVLAGCASVPSVDGIIDGTPRKSEIVVGAHGPLSPEQSRAVIDRLGAQSDVLQRHLAIEQEVAGTPLSVGNHTQLLHDGPETFHAMFAAMKRARRNIFLEYYIFENVESDNTYLVDLLSKKARAGVSVAVIYDSFGSVDTPQDVFDRLQAAGVKLLGFHPLLDVGAINDRDHRKILAVDNRTAIVGGVNLYTVYQAHPHSRMVASDGPSPDTWHDTDLEIEGPAAAELQQVFLTHWQDEQGPPLKPVAERPPPASGNQAVRIIASDHNDTIPRYYATILSAIRSAEKSIWIAAAYFVPTEEEKHDLIAAAKRGVDVRLLLPGNSDERMAQAVGRANYGDLLKAGIHIFEEQDGMLHSKWATIDGVWSVVGSSNFDHRSILFNDEVDAVVLGRETAAQLESLFDTRIAKAKPVTLQAWDDRPLSERFRELYSRAIESLL